MPEFVESRQNPHFIYSKNEETLYVFGGGQNSLEKLDLTKNHENQKWEYMSALRQKQVNNINFYSIPS